MRLRRAACQEQPATMRGGMNTTRTDNPQRELKSLRRRLDGVCTRDFGRLFGRWRKLSRMRGLDAEKVAGLRRDIDQSHARREERAAAKPALSVDTALPVSEHAEDIIAAIRDNQIIVVAGETGSGKTTQLPQLCLAAGQGEAGLVGCTQPRRLAARSVSRRVAEEMGTQVGDQVGFQVRFTEQVSDVSLVKFMTDGILLAESQSDPWLSAYDTLIIDEAHERSLNIDFLLGYLKRLLARRRNLKVIITSATIDTARFAEHFNDAPVIEVEGRTYPVEVRWRPGDEDVGAEGGPEHIASAVDELTAETPRGDVLVFLPGEREIREAHRELQRRQYRNTEILPLYARLSAGEQDRIFQPGSKRRIVLATNVAETSLTVPRIHAVVDTGTARVMRYSQRSQIERLHSEPVSQAAADQRKGRCGRVGPGICIRLYSEDDFAQRRAFTDPELLRSSLANVILRMLALRLGDVESFPFLDMPEQRAINDGYRRLGEVSAIDADRQLTDTGRELARLPIDVQLARMLLEARQRGVLREMLVLVAFLSVQDPRERPPHARQEADAAHRQFVDKHSDFLGVLNLWQAWETARQDLTRGQLRQWCQKRFLGQRHLREWREIHRQLKSTLQDKSAKSGGNGAKRGGESAKRSRRAGAGDRTRTEDDAAATPDRAAYQAIHMSLLAGLPMQVGWKDEYGVFRGARQRKFQVFPGSALADKPPKWLFAGQILDVNGKVWAMQCARIEPEWVEQQAAHLLRRTWHEPHWSRRKGAVLAREQVSLFGLVLVEGRRVRYGKQDPETAHQVFLQDALACCEIDARADFVAANARILAEAHDIEARQRRQGLIRSEPERAAFFEGKLPADISDARALDAWYRKKATRAEQAALCWTLADVMDGTAEDAAGAYPETWSLDGREYHLSYRFVPGDEADGVTLKLPLALLNAVPDAACQWLVPGLAADKVAELIRGLPKTKRRNFVPAPDFARAFLQSEPDQEQALLPTLATFLKQTTGVDVDAADFSPAALPAHLHMRFSLRDETDTELASSRDLSALCEQWAGSARSAFSQQADPGLERENLTGWDIGDLPERVGGGAEPTAFPALVAGEGAAAVRLFERRETADAAHVQGVRQLLWLQLARPLQQAQRKLPVARETAMQHAVLANDRDLAADMVAGAFADLSAERDLMLRDATAFQALRDDLASELFAAAVHRLQLAEPVIAVQAELQSWLQPPRQGQSPESYADLREQAEHLLAPGFLRDLPASRLRHYPRYLKAMRLRAERLQRDPGKDKRHLQEMRPYWQAYTARVASGEASDGLSRVHWLLEEWRVSLFAQELKTAEPVSAKRVARALEALE